MNVSVVVPTIGRDALANALACLRLQSEPVEAVIIDDSSDSSAHERVAEMIVASGIDKTESVARLISTGGVGLAAARNIGIREAGRPLIALLDDDDVVCPHHIRRLLDSAGAPGDHVFAWSASTVYFVNSADRSWREGPTYGWEGAAESLPHANVIPPSGVLFDRGQAPRFDESIPALEDWDAWLQLTMQDGLIPRYTGFRTVGYTRDVGLRDSMSLRALTDPAIIKPVIDAYWMICGRYAAPNDQILSGRLRFGQHQLEWLRLQLLGGELAEDYYEQILADEFGPVSPNACCDFQLGEAALGNIRRGL